MRLWELKQAQIGSSPQQNVLGYPESGPDYYHYSHQSTTTSWPSIAMEQANIGTPSNPASVQSVTQVKEHPLDLTHPKNWWRITDL